MKKYITDSHNLLINIIFLILGIALAVASFFLFGKTVLIMYVIAFIALYVPLSIRSGMHMVMYERTCVLNQISHNLPVSYNEKRFRAGYIKVFLPIYTFLFASLFIPARGLWLIPFIPVSIVVIVMYKIFFAPWVDIGLKKSKYRMIHFSIFAGIVIFALLFRLVIFPGVYAG